MVIHNKYTIDNISVSTYRMFCGASFSSAAEAATSSVAADDKKRVALDVNGRLPVNAKAFAIFCPQRNIMTEVVENFIGETPFSKLLLYKIQLFWASLIFDAMIGMEEKDILDFILSECVLMKLGVGTFGSFLL